MESQFGNCKPKHCLTPMKPIDALKKGLSKPHDQVQEQKTRLTDKLKAGDLISDNDQE